MRIAMPVFRLKNSTHSRVGASISAGENHSYLQNKEAVKELFGVVADKVAERPGGYCRILKTGHRLGDNAEMCFIELVDFNEAMLASEKSDKKKKTTRRSRRKAAPAAEAPAAEAPAEVAE